MFRLSIQERFVLNHLYSSIEYYKHSMSESTEVCIQIGDFIVIQRQKYAKLHKFGSLDSASMLGKEQIQLRNIVDHPYGSTFKMCVKDVKMGGYQRGRQHSLEICSEQRSIREVLGISASGLDNRDISDNGDSQTLKSEDIQQLRDECSESSKIIEKIVENSKTFQSKTEYSQEKYLKKKEKKYFEFVQIRKPTIRLLSEIFYRQDAEKILGIRIDTLSQIISYSGVCANGSYLLYESGTNGLLPAAMLNSIGANTSGTLVHLHPGNVPQKQAVLAMKFSPEQMQRCISVNLYSVLREFFQGNGPQQISDAEIVDTNSPEVKEPCNKKPKLDGAADDDENESEKTMKKWQIENRRACELMANKFDGIVIAAKEHPAILIKELLPLVKPSRPFVIYSPCKELLMEMYVEMKSSSQVTNLHLTSNWLRMYQILPNRSHPEVNMNNNGGYLLTGYTIKA